MFGKFRPWWQRQQFEDEMSEELRFHRDQFAQDLMASGVPANEAQRRAKLELGPNSVAEECRDARGLAWADELVRQVRYSLRGLRQRPGFAATALATLGICLGANLALYAIIDVILLRPLPFPDADRLVTLYNSYPKAGVDRDGASLTNYYERRGQIPAFTSLSISRRETSLVGEPGATERVLGLRVSPEFFTTLGVGPRAGRAFTEQETTYQTARSVILTHEYWQQHPRRLGDSLRVDGVPLTVVGILPAGFRFLSSPAKLYFPLASRPEDRAPAQRHSGNSITMIARLAPGATLAEAQAQIDAQDRSLAPSYRQPQLMADAGFHTVIASLHGDHVLAVRPTLLLLLAGALVLLLIGVVNLANLLLVRANGRAKEMAVRQALGASRRQLVTEAIVEAMVLSLLGSLLGGAAGAAGIRLLATLGANQLPLGAQIAFDVRVALVALLAALAIGLALAVPIAWFSLHTGTLQTESRTGTATGRAQHLRHAFVVAQTALAFVLLAGAGLLAMSLRNVLAVSPGFEQQNVLTGQIALPWTQYPGGPRRFAFVTQLAQTLSSTPGVLAAGISNNLPFSGKAGKSAAIAKGYVPPPGASVRGHYGYSVAGDYFGALGFRLISGRFLAPQETRRVCVVDEDFARHYWQGGNAVGQRIFTGSQQLDDSQAYTVVGVVRSVKQTSLADEAAQGAYFLPYQFNPDDDLFLTLRTNLAPETMSLALQRAVRQADPDMPVIDIRSMENRIDESLVTRRSPAMLALAFAAIAVLLTALGTYGVLSYAVTQRRREIAVRMALGARPGQIQRQFFFAAARFLLLGTALGLAGAWVTGTALETILYRVSAWNAPILAAGCLVMTLVSLVASLLPAYRAAQTPPVEALSE